MQSLSLQRCSVIETPNGRFVEMLLAATPEPGESEAQIHFLVPVSEEGYPRLPAAQLEALVYVRNAIGDENRRLQDIRGQVYPSEDW